jgi:hypothetical protein
MVTFLITSLFILGFLAVAVYFWQKPASRMETEAQLPPPPFEPRGLFAGEDSAASEIESADSRANLPAESDLRSSLLERSSQGDQSVLVEVHRSGDREFYNQALDFLVTQADSSAKLLSLVSYVTRNELPVNNRLARECIESWKRTPDRPSTAKMLHIAALSDDAGIYQSAAETALQFRRDGYLSGISPRELQAILEGEFWVLSSHTRSSGAAFLLKRTLAKARRELEAPETIRTTGPL